MATKVVALSPDVRDILARSTINGPVLILPAGQLDRKLYEAVDKTLKAMGGKWSRRHNGHLFARPDLRQALDQALGDGQVIDRKRTLEQFWTPIEVAFQLCDLVGDFEGEDVLEPSAGGGTIFFAALERQPATITAIEIDRDLAVQLEAECEGRWPVICADFMAWNPSPPMTPAAFDVVLMNPPFSRNQDIGHVRRAYSFLKPWGRLAAVMSPHWTFAQDSCSRQFRADLDQMKERGGTVEWRDLPGGTFQQSGTGVNAGILSLRKPG